MFNRFQMFCVGMAFAAVSSCTHADAATVPERVAFAKEALTHNFNDPEATRFRNVRAVDQFTVCGEFNAKNRLGAYTGYQPFAVVYDGKRGKHEPLVMTMADVGESAGAEELALDMMKTLCNN